MTAPPPDDSWRFVTAASPEPGIVVEGCWPFGRGRVMFKYQRFHREDDDYWTPEGADFAFAPAYWRPL